MSRQYRRKIQRQIQKLFRHSERKRRRRINNRHLDFAQLEPKQLLAVVANALPNDANLISNGDFENVDITGGNLLDAADVPGWGISGTTGQQINIFATDRAGNVLELDSTIAHIDGVFQDIETTSGETYALAFDFRERDAGSSADPTSNDIEVFWDGRSLGVYTPDEQWQSAVLRVEGGSGDTTRLEFRESDFGSDGIGGLIDNVRLVMVETANVGNGSFENVTGSGNLFPDSSVAAWSSAATDRADRQLNIVEDSNATHGSRYLNLETTAENTDIVYQSVSTTAGEQYYLTFDLMGDPETTEASNELRIRWDGQWAGTYHGNGEWQSVGILLDASSDLSRLVFRETATGTGSGPIIDNVRLYQVTQDPGPINDLAVDIDTDQDGSNGTARFFEGSGPTSIITDGIALFHDSNSTLTSATIKIENLMDGPAESLAVDVGTTGLIATYDESTGRLGVSGTATVAEYESVLETLTYDNTSPSPATETRSISISITDREISEGPNFSPRAFVDVSISPANDRPEIVAIADRTLDFGTSVSIQVDATDPESSELTYELSTEGDVGADTPTISDTGRITWDAVLPDGGEVTFTVTVTDAEGASAEEEFSITIRPFDAFAGNRALSNIDPALRDEIYDAAPEMSIDTNLNYVAILDTTVGEIRLELFADQAPLTVNNFVNLAEDGFYDGVTFHRVISGFVAQGGDPLGTGTGGPGYSFADEFVDELVFDKRGQLAMANSGPATNGSQFFITYAAQSHLTGVHTIFGQISAGDSVLDSISLTGGGADPTVINSIEIITV